jgi:16S rRNA (guanine966-N2)-methyltransferase
LKKDMTRIIAGLLGSKRLISPAKSTRPTSDRIRESLFSSLESKSAIDGSKVLDLFAGTGALALEALSRGAKSAVLVEKNTQAAKICKQNLDSALSSIQQQGFEATGVLKMQPAIKFLEQTTEKFDLVFVDPPYEMENAELEETLQKLRVRLEPNALVIVERSAKSKKPNSSGFSMLQEKAFGSTVLYWLVQD